MLFASLHFTRLDLWCWTSELRLLVIALKTMFLIRANSSSDMSGIFITIASRCPNRGQGPVVLNTEIDVYMYRVPICDWIDNLSMLAV